MTGSLSASPSRVERFLDPGRRPRGLPVKGLRLGRGAQNALLTVGIVLLWGLWVARAMPGFWLVLVIVTVPLANVAIRRTVDPPSAAWFAAGW